MECIKNNFAYPNHCECEQCNKGANQMTINKETLAEDRKVAEAAADSLVYDMDVAACQKRFNPATMLQYINWMEGMIEENEQLKAELKAVYTNRNTAAIAQAKRIEELKMMMRDLLTTLKYDEELLASMNGSCTVTMPCCVEDAEELLKKKG